MVFGELYEKRKIDKIRWICGTYNLANAMTKASPNFPLKNLILTSKVTIKCKVIKEELPVLFHCLPFIICNVNRIYDILPRLSYLY